MNINQLVGSSSFLNNIQSSTVNKNNSSSESEGSSFFSTLKQKLDEVNDKQLEADAATEAFIKGDDVDVHEVMLATEEAKLSLQMTVQVRNKLVEAYQEINRMQL